MKEALKCCLLFSSKVLETNKLNAQNLFDAELNLQL